MAGVYTEQYSYSQLVDIRDKARTATLQTRKESMVYNIANAVVSALGFLGKVSVTMSAITALVNSGVETNKQAVDETIAAVKDAVLNMDDAIIFMANHRSDITLVRMNIAIETVDNIDLPIAVEITDFHSTIAKAWIQKY